MISFQSWLYKAVNILTNSKSPRIDAETLLKFVTGKDRAFILAFSETLLTTEQEIFLDTLINIRKIGYPIAYLTGEREFWSLSLNVSKDVLIPRQDTECLVEQALIVLPDKPSHILDLGTGTGAIALAIASERPDCKIIAVDFQDSVIRLAKNNAKRLSLKNVQVVQSNWFNKVSYQKFEMIISNPPYIGSNDPHLLNGDLKFEPSVALVSDEEGKADLKYIILNAYNYLSPKGSLLVEHSWMQGEFVRELFFNRGYQFIETHIDYSGNERLTIGSVL